MTILQRILAIISVSAVVVSSAGCIRTSPPNNETQSPTSSSESEAIHGEVPEPSKMPPLEPDRQKRIQKANELDFGRLLDGPDRFNQMIATYFMVGLPVISSEDNPVMPGYVGEGLAVPWWEVWYQVGGAKGGGTTLSAIADQLLEAAAFPQTPNAEKRQQFQQVLLDDVLSALQSDTDSADDRVFAFGAAVLSGGDFTTETHLDALQANILSRTFAGDLLFEAAHGADTPEIVPTTHSVAKNVAAPSTPCRFNSAEQSVVRIGEEIISRAVRGQQLIPAPWIFDRAAGGWSGRLPGVLHFLERSFPHIKTVTGKLGAAQLVLDTLKLSAQIFALRIDSTLDKQPLVRTRTEEAGEDAILSAKVFIDIEGQWANCLRLVYAQLGLRAGLPQQGVLAGHSVTVKGGRNFPTDVGEDNAKVWFVNIGLDRRPDNQLTDSGGVAKVGIQGAPQKRKMSNIPQEDTFSVRIAVKLNQTGFLVDMWDAATTAVRGTPQEAAASFLLNLLKRFRWEGPEQFFELRDWAPEGVYFVTEDHRHTETSDGKGPNWSSKDTEEYVADPSKRSDPVISEMRCDEFVSRCSIEFVAWSIDTFTSLTTKLSNGDSPCRHPYQEVIHQRRGLATVSYDQTQQPQSVDAVGILDVFAGGIGACVMFPGDPDEVITKVAVNFEDLMSGQPVTMNLVASGTSPVRCCDTTGEIKYHSQTTLSVRRVNSDGSPYISP